MAIETRIYRHSPIIDLVAAIDRKDDAIAYYRHEQEIEGNHVFRDVIKGIRRDRSGLVLQLLDYRADNPSSGAQLTLVRYPDEEYFEVSQNKLRLTFPNYIPHLRSVNTGLDLLADAKGSGDSEEVLATIGDIDILEDETPEAYLSRTNEEIRASQRRFGKAEASGNAEEMERMGRIKKMLIKRMLLDIRKPGLVSSEKICVAATKRGDIKLITGENVWILVKTDPDIEEWVYDSGGIDFYD